MKAGAENKTIFLNEVDEYDGSEIFISGSYAERSITASSREKFSTEFQTSSQGMGDSAFERQRKRFYLAADSSTSRHILSALLRRSVDEIFIAAREEEFEYGQESNFSLRLNALIYMHGFNALREIQNRLSEEFTNPDLIVEALHSLGRSQHQDTRLHRLTILLVYLQAPLPVIRRGAALGIAYMDDPQAIPTLQLALAQEINPFVKVSFQRVLEQLQETQLHA